MPDATAWVALPPAPEKKNEDEKPSRHAPTYSSDCLDTWFKVMTLTENSTLCLEKGCEYDAHAALRHAHDVDLNGYALTIEMPEAYGQKKAGFGPWLAKASGQKTLPEKKVAVLFVASTQQIHQISETNHSTTLDMRIGGENVRVLLDTGATCSCMSESFATRVGLPIETQVQKNIGGLGGTVKTVGVSKAPIKIRRYHTENEFFVLDKTIAGYHVLLGQDFMIKNQVSIVFKEDSLDITIGNAEEPVRLSQSLLKSRNVNMIRSTHYAMPIGMQPAAPIAQVVAVDTERSKVGSNRERSKSKKKARQKVGISYRIILAGDILEGSGSMQLHPDIKKVVEKHSKKGGTLCGTIPENTHAKGYSCKILCKDGAEPVYIRQYRLTPLEKVELLRQVDDFIKKGWIEPSTSAWSSSVLFTPKPNGKLRFCVDYRKVNEVSSPNRSPLANQTEMLDLLQGNVLFSALDLASGYYQLEMDENSRELTAFPTPYGLMQWRVMPMGLSNAPAVFQQAMNGILKEHIRKGYCLVYLDDIIIMSKSTALHAQHLDAVLKTLNGANLFCQLPKCFWGRNQLKYLGHIVNGQGVSPDPSKVATLDMWKPPHDLIKSLKSTEVTSGQKMSNKRKIVKECRRYLGFMNYFNRFIPRYSELAAPLHDQTKDEAPEWDRRCTTAWTSMSVALQRATMMFHPVPDEEYHVYSDASIRGVGGVLMQYHKSHLCPVAYCARKLIPAETRYSTTEQELLAMIYCFSKWRCYLEGAPKVFMHTDHEPLTWLKTQAALNRRQSHWLEFMARFVYQVLYVKGDKNVVADALTRMLTLPEPDQPELPGDWWVDTVATLTRMPLYRPDKDRICCSSEETRRRATFIASISKRMEGWTDAESTSGPCERGGNGVRGSEKCPPLGLFPTVLLGGYTRRQAERNTTRSCPGEESEGTPVPPVNEFRKRLLSRVNVDQVPKERKRMRFSEDATEPSRSESHRVASDDTDVRSPESNGEKRLKRIHEEARGTGSDPPCASGEPRPDQSFHEHDMLFESLIERIQTGLPLDDLIASERQRVRMKLKEKDGLLWREGKLYIPRIPDDTLIDDILYWHHDVPWCSHLGIDKTVRLVQHQFWWPRMDEDIRKYIGSCTDCQRNKTDRKNRTPLLSPLAPPGTCWYTIGVDLIVDLPRTREHNHNAICVFVCHLSKMVRLVACDTTVTAVGFAKLFMKEVFVHYGMPQNIVSDRGSQWNSEFFKALCNQAGVLLKLSTAYHPKTNGLVERTNEVVETALRHYVSANQDDWDDYLPLVEFALNSAYHKTLDSTPFKMNRISVPRNPFEVLLKSNTGPDDEGDIAKKDELPLTSVQRWMGMSKIPAENGIRTIIQAKSQLEWAKKCVHLAKMRMKEQHDKKIKSFHLYEEGELVWFNVKHLKLKHPSHRHKFLPKFMGPLRILEKIGRSAVKLELPAGFQIHSTVSTSLIKPYEQRTDSEPPPVNVDGLLEFEVEAIVNHHIVKTKRRNAHNYVEFKVKWRGYVEESWEMFECFEHSLDLLNKYLSSQVDSRQRQRMYTVLQPEELEFLCPKLLKEAKAHLKIQDVEED